MKNLKISLTAVIAAIILATSTSVFATDTNVTFDDTAIKMPTSLTNGKGEVTGVTVGATKMSYQFVVGQISDQDIAKIERYEEEVKIAEAYGTYVEGQIDPSDATNPDLTNYQSLLAAYKNKYYKDATEETQIMSLDGVTALNTSTAFNRAVTVDVWESYIATLYGQRPEAWTESTDNKTVEIDLSTIEGTKNVVLWVKCEGSRTAYRPQYYKVTGTKKAEEPKNEQKNEAKNETEIKQENNKKPVQNIGKETSTSKLPYTGASTTIIAIIAVAAVAAGVSYIKYRNVIK